MTSTDPADPGFVNPGPTDTLPQVIGNATTWLRGISVALATLFLTLGGIRWLFAREPSDVDRARSSITAAGVGFAFALLAPQVVSIVRTILGDGNG